MNERERIVSSVIQGVCPKCGKEMFPISVRGTRLFLTNVAPENVKVLARWFTRRCNIEGDVAYRCLEGHVYSVKYSVKGAWE